MNRKVLVKEVSTTEFTKKQRIDQVSKNIQFIGGDIAGELNYAIEFNWCVLEQSKFLNNLECFQVLKE